jgi:hypothetical protein
MALTKVKNSNLDDADLVALAGNDGSALTGVSVSPSSITGVTSTAAELNILDGVTSTAAELNILDGVTSTAAELNILDGVTSTAAELNILDGVTASTAELNYVDGVTSAIQTQLDGKQASDADLTTLATNGIGTSANQLVQLNSSAELPAVSGANLTNLPASGTTFITGRINSSSSLAWQSGGISSITNSGTSRCKINFTTSMSSTSYAVAAIPWNAGMTVAIVGKNVAWVEIEGTDVNYNSYATYFDVLIEVV